MLDGDGFRLRRSGESDAPRIHEGTAEPATQRWLGHKPAPYTLDDAHAYVERRRELAATGQCVTWAIADPDDDRLLGTVLWFDWTPGVECEIGYWTHPEARGRGLATAAARLVDRPRLRDARGQAGHGFAAAENAASRASSRRPASGCTASSGTARRCATAASTWPSTT